MYTDRIFKALELSATAHLDQFRKATGKVPYIVHPVSVGMLLVQFGYPEDVVIAGILHDTVEDTDVTVDDIRKKFGDAVAGFVDECSEQDKSLPWEERKKQYIEHMKTATPEAKAISCCDKIHNMKSMAYSADAGLDVWAHFKRGKDKQITRHAALLPIFAETLKAEMVSVYEAALNRMKEL